MTLSARERLDLRRSIVRLCEGQLTDEEGSQLKTQLADSEESRQIFAGYNALVALLELEVPTLTSDACGTSEFDLMEDEAGENGARNIHSATSTFPGLGLSGIPWIGPTSYMSSGWPVAYLVATVMTAFGLIICANMYISPPSQVVGPTAVEWSAVSPASRDSMQQVVVGRVTGMADCKWAGSGENSQKDLKSHVSLGDQLNIRSGLVEITYDTGAKVILQGPVMYEVESKNGGFMLVGKLTGKVENETAKGFFVRTPTAVVTDLGTEFGVEVSREGNTISHVFRGAIAVRVASAGGRANADPTILHANESVRVDGGNGKYRVLSVPASLPTHFIREVPKQQEVKLFDLVDVVAGGDGFSGKRNRGIDSATGRMVMKHARDEDIPPNDGKYHRVVDMPFVDGVFVPSSHHEVFQIDSAGHQFNGFICSTDKTSHCVWAGGSVPSNAVVSTELGGVDYGSPGHGLIFLHANKGVTFDLDAIRRANRNYRVDRFLATAGDLEKLSTDAGSSIKADIWVIIDGRSRFQRREINRSSGAFDVNIPIATNDRFLTLAATDGGDDIQADWIIFGDPRLELVPGAAESEKAFGKTNRSRQ